MAIITKPQTEGVAISAFSSEMTGNGSQSASIPVEWQNNERRNNFVGRRNDF